MDVLRSERPHKDHRDLTESSTCPAPFNSLWWSPNFDIAPHHHHHSESSRGAGGAPLVAGGATLFAAEQKQTEYKSLGRREQMECDFLLGAHGERSEIMALG